MSKTKNPASVVTTSRALQQKELKPSATFVNFNDTTVLHIFQVLSDLLAEQENTEKVKLSIKKAVDL